MEIVLRATVIFVFLLVVTRGLRRRSLGDMAPFEMILLVVVGDIVQQSVTQEDMSITGGVLAVSTFGFWIVVLSYLTWRSERVAKVIDGVPVLILRDGEPIDEALQNERMPISEVYEAARQEGIDDLSTLRAAVLEPSGRISFIR
ncbi:MAG TPA: YetF domain-containing protein [Acidimicrobiales bacterium]|nr:YetF domain-containing protein [Acidimicrobiales bacterium]